MHANPAYKPRAGASFARKPGAFGWEPGDGTAFKVRTGPNYSRNGKKAPSKAPFYECCAQAPKMKGSSEYRQQE